MTVKRGDGKSAWSKDDSPYQYIKESKVKEALDYIFGRLKDKRPVTETVGEVTYAVRADGTLGEPVRELAPQWTKPTLELHSLSGLVAALLKGFDGLEPEKVLVHVVDPWAVKVSSAEADRYGRRHLWALALYKQDVSFAFGNYYKPDDFLIAFRSSFLYNDDAVKVQQVCSTVGSGEAVLVADDGVSQEITVKSGTVTRSAINLPADGIPLVPWRTFRDAAPVMSKFLLRMKGAKEGLPTIALHEIDAQWKRETVNSVAHYLTDALPGFTIIS